MTHKDEINPKPFMKSEKEKQEFTYPMWFKNKNFDIIVRFDGLTFCEVVQSNNKRYPVGFKNVIVNHTDADVWEQVEEPKIIEDKKDNFINNGGSTDYYKLPKDAKDLQDLIEYKDMNFALGNIFKAVYRLGNCSHSDTIRDLNKIVYFANREIERLNK